MARAIQLAVENVRSGRGGPFGAVVVRGGEIISEGVNCVTLSNDPTAHAEVVAIRAACAKLGALRASGLRSVYVLRALPDVPRSDLLGSPGASLFRLHRRGRRRWPGSTTRLSTAKCMQQHAERKIPMVQMMREEALETFRTWERQPNKLPY